MAGFGEGDVAPHYLRYLPDRDIAQIIDSLDSLSRCADSVACVQSMRRGAVLDKSLMLLGIVHAKQGVCEVVQCNKTVLTATHDISSSF
eukprot:1157738-Pelagomonas_calceolata.AAC.3